METAWTFRIVLIMAFAVIIFGDFLGYGNAKKSDHSHTNDLSIDHQQHHPRGKWTGEEQVNYYNYYCIESWLLVDSGGTSDLAEY